MHEIVWSWHREIEKRNCSMGQLKIRPILVTRQITLDYTLMGAPF